MDGRLVVLGLARGDDLYDAFLDGDQLVLARVGRPPRHRSGLGGPLLLLLTYVAAVYSKIGLKRLPGATGTGLTAEDETLSRERLRLQGLPLDRLVRRHASNRRLPTAGLHARVIAGDGEDAPLVELSRGVLKEPMILEAVGDPPDRLLRALRDRGAVVEGAL